MTATGDPPLLCLMGPTAAGKTAAAMALAERLDVDVISVDSAMVYRRMDIGTGKPDTTELARVPHALIDVREPHEPYSAADFAADARALLQRSWSVGRLPVLVGGTGLYFRALLQGLSPLPAASAAVRAEIVTLREAHGTNALHARLTTLDPVTAARLHPNDTQRLERAIEVCLVSGRPMSELVRTGGEPLAARVLKLVICPEERADLHHRIGTRFDGMLARGLVDEVRALMRDARLHRDTPSMRAVGYRQTWDFLAGEGSRDDLAARGKAATRQLARRQLTWLRKEDDATWVSTESGAGRARLLERAERFAAAR